MNENVVDLLNTEAGDFRNDLRDEKKHRLLKMTVAGIRETEKGFTLQANTTDKKKVVHEHYITLFPEDNVELTKQMLIKLIGKEIIIKNAHKKPINDVNGKFTGLFNYRALYTGMENIEVIGDYTNFTDGKFWIFKVDSDYYQVLSVIDKEFKEFDSQSKKMKTYKQMMITTSGVEDYEFKLNKVLIILKGDDLKNFDESAFTKKITGKKLKFTEKIRVEGSDKKDNLYYTHTLPLIEEVKTQSAPKTEQK